ncbi:TonB-dependent receptor [Aquabacterium sp. A7-Y]|uniref:TonB-dependent receptor plug domain-containing protein n=1 Tax=Aquabacterium sp. A7-Y TaxID=1349605 RepID=UPI00223DC662|nr:TonB-dependent receptor [Aquabacterium sp. A7-Y]MCW7541755.1 TonB-dependent receptor [Aquabacterium sp. A7-Y]
MFNRNAISAAWRTITLGAIGLVPPTSAPCQEAQRFERVEITGSAVRRIQGETALPVQVITRQDIERTGASSVGELVQALPSMQAFTNDATAVGGTTSGGGFNGASIHGLGEDKTLVLLNGRRLATFAGQTLSGAFASVDLNVIPLAAIERVEVLTDGASALYGADAVAGVVNFITKNDSSEGAVALGGSMPGQGAREGRFSLSKGFGDYDMDGYNVLVSGSYEKRDALRSVDRSFARTGVLRFSRDGKRYRLSHGSINSIPANLQDPNGDFYNPYLQSAGTCAAKSFQVGSACNYDFMQDLEIVPERERGAFYASASKALDDHRRLYAEALLSNTTTTARIAPPPGGISVLPGAFPQAPSGGLAFYRIAAVGPRTDENVSTARHFVIGSDGRAGRFDYDLSYTRSKSTYRNNAKGGWLSQSAADDALLQVNPFLPLEQLSPQDVATLRDAQRMGFFQGGEGTLDHLLARASTEIAQLPGGAMSVAGGVSYLRDRFDRIASDLAQGIGDTRFGDPSQLVPYQASRHAWGAFAEVLAPVVQQVELGAATRHDRYSDIGGSTTAKGMLRWQPTSGVLLRASLGTGFKAPTPAQINATQQVVGVTGGAYPCEPGSALAHVAASLGASCRPDVSQYETLAAGNKNLEPEKSTQWSLGVRLEPQPSFSFGADIWNVKVRNWIGQVDDSTVFSNPEAWRQKFTTFFDPGTRQTYLAFLANNDNLGEGRERGIDFDVQGRLSTPAGRLNSKFIATYMLQDKYQLLKDGPYYSNLGRYGESGGVVFRWIGRWINTLQAGDFAHTLTLHFRSGFTDQPYRAEDRRIEQLDENGRSLGFVDMQRRVKRHITFDWQTAWTVNKQFHLVGGILNVADTDPPLSINTSDGGHMIGYDDRYYDARGRTFYLNAAYSF